MNLPKKFCEFTPCPTIMEIFYNQSEIPLIVKKTIKKFKMIPNLFITNVINSIEVVPSTGNRHKNVS